MWSKISPVQKSLMIQKVGPVSFYFSLLFPTNLKLVSKHPKLKMDYENAWIAEVLIKNVIVNARGNHSKGPVQQPRCSFHPLPYMFHANYHLATNTHSSPPLDSVDNTHDPMAHIPSPPSPSLQSDIMLGIPPLLCPCPKCVNNTHKIAPQIPSPPSTHVEPGLSSFQGNKHLQFQLTDDDDDKPPNTAQMTKKRTPMKVMMIGPNV